MLIQVIYLDIDHDSFLYGLLIFFLSSTGVCDGTNLPAAQW